MALVQCPECGKEVSDTANNCPNCGYPIAQKEVTDNPVSSTIASNAPKKKFPLKAIVGACLLIVLIVGVAFLTKGRNSVVGTWEDSDTLNGYVIIFQFSEDGKFSSSIQVNGTTIPGGTGKYEIDGKNLNIYMDNGETTSEEFTLKGDTLTLGIQTLTRQK